MGVKAAGASGLTTLSPSCADCLEINLLEPSGLVEACNGIVFFFLKVSLLLLLKYRIFVYINVELRLFRIPVSRSLSTYICL